MPHVKAGGLDPSPWFDNVAALAPAALDPVALLDANLQKMHHQQATAQNIRTWSFAFVAFLLGSTYFHDPRLEIAVTVFVIAELVLFVILLREIDWHRMFWKYRDRARVCEAYLLGMIDKARCREEYLRTEDVSRASLLRGAFSPRQIGTVTTDFVEVYLMLAVGLAFAVRFAIA